MTSLDKNIPFPKKDLWTVCIYSRLYMEDALIGLAFLESSEFARWNEGC